MLDPFIKAIIEASDAVEYESAVAGMAANLYSQGRASEALELKRIAHLQKNRFSDREAANELNEKKAAIQHYYESLKTAGAQNPSNAILTILNNFPSFCKRLYQSEIHGKCSAGVKTNLKGFCIENEYDLQKLMYAAFSLCFSDARTEVAQDSGHHAVRKDIFIDSASSVIELKCTRNRMSARQLSEEIASDMVHYNERTIYFYIYDKAGIIQNEAAFKRTYESRNVDGKEIYVVIYSHDDI